MIILKIIAHYLLSGNCEALKKCQSLSERFEFLSFIGSECEDSRKFARESSFQQNSSEELQKHLEFAFCNSSPPEEDFEGDFMNSQTWLD